MLETKIIDIDSVLENPSDYLQEIQDYASMFCHPPIFRSMLVVFLNGEIVTIADDDMAPEDANFGRNLKWIASLLLQVYELGTKG